MRVEGLGPRPGVEGWTGAPGDAEQEGPARGNLGTQMSAVQEGCVLRFVVQQGAQAQHLSTISPSPPPPSLTSPTPPSPRLPLPRLSPPPHLSSWVMPRPHPLRVSASRKGVADSALGPMSSPEGSIASPRGVTLSMAANRSEHANSPAAAADPGKAAPAPAAAAAAVGAGGGFRTGGEATCEGGACGQRESRGASNTTPQSPIALPFAASALGS